MGRLGSSAVEKATGLGAVCPEINAPAPPGWGLCEWLLNLPCKIQFTRILQQREKMAEYTGKRLGNPMAKAYGNLEKVKVGTWKIILCTQN